MTGNPGDQTYDPVTQGIPVNVVSGVDNVERIAQDVTVAAGQVMLIASGEDFVCGNMTVNGTLINAGTLRCKSFTTGAGGLYVAEAGSKKEIFSLY
jgi:phage baseplate assembly protein gpV